MPVDLNYLRDRLPGRRIEWFDSIGSTMTEATRLAAEGAGHGALVGADEQTAGIGRYGRHWHSEPESGIYMSVVLRLPFGIETLPLVTLALGLAAAEAIQKTTDLNCDLRWPNDVLIGGRKCCGILTHLETPAIIAGIGINVNQESFPPELAAVATSLRIAGGRIYKREPIIAELLLAIDSYCGILETQGRDPILRMFTQVSSYALGRRVEVDQGDTILRGITAGLNSAGYLLVRDNHGKQHQIIAGGVRPCS